jgi:hypothetical protein
MDSLMKSNPTGRSKVGARAGGLVALVAFLVLPAAAACLSGVEPGRRASGQAAVRFPTVPAGHEHARALLENACALFAPDNKMIDPASGYPFEGWNNDPKQGLLLRSFTQLTAVALWMELLGNVVAGYADTPHLPRERALAQLAQLVKTLRQDQRDPRVSADGLLSNFLDLAGGRRRGPLIGEVDRSWFRDAFGQEKGEAVWKALEAKGRVVPHPDDLVAPVNRGPRYGSAHFDGPLAPFADPATRERVMAILDQRVVLTVFGDNANLSLSAAKTIGALLVPGVRDRPEVAGIRRDLEQFLEDQRPGYTRLYDRQAGMFYFGRDATKDRLFGWVDQQEKRWKAGHMDYLVNEFRGPAAFVVLRHGLPVEALANLGFKMKPYRTRDGRDLCSLAPWDGSAFQVLGLNLSLQELESPSWRRLLENLVDIEIDFAARKNLPGFLSESYTGEGARYTRKAGIPDISVSPEPRVTDSASLYTLGTAYSVAPDKVEQFLAANWPVVSKLRTDHGPWEGFNVARQEAIRIQTSAHTLSLILGMLGTGPGHLKRYLDSRDLGGALSELFRPGERVDLLSGPTRVFAWADREGALRSSRQGGTFHVRGGPVRQLGMAFVPARKGGVNLSGGLLSIRYHSAAAAGPTVIALKSAGPVNPGAGIIATEVFTRLADTGGREEEIRIPLPATPGLRTIKEVVLTCGQADKELHVDLRITHFSVTPPPP